MRAVKGARGFVMIELLIAVLRGRWWVEAQRYHELEEDHVIVLVTDNGPALKSRIFSEFIDRSPFLHVRGKERHP